METKKVKWENELQALNNIVTNLNLTGCTVHVNHNGGRKKETYFLRDSEGGTLTGSWTYDRLNHFIMGYGKAISHLSENPQTETKVEDVQVGGLPNKITLLVTGSGMLKGDEPKNTVLLRSDDATIHLQKGTEFGKLSHALIDRYNHFDAMVNTLHDAYDNLLMGNTEAAAKGLSKMLNTIISNK